MKKASLKEACHLFQDGSLAFMDMEANGLLVDIDYCNQKIVDLDEEISELLVQLETFSLYKEGRKKYGAKWNINSTKQLSDVIYDLLGHRIDDAGTKGSSEEDTQEAVDHKALVDLGLDCADELFRYRMLCKAKETYLAAFIRQIDKDNLLHPSFHLHKVVSFRSSSSDPNLQNIAKRGEMGSIVRRAIIARPGHHLCEIDYANLEVRGAAWYHEDPNMLDYLHDSSKDMHRDMACQCYMLDASEVGKDVRNSVKSGFVFAELYGSWYKQCASVMWDSIEKLELKTNSGTCLREHLRSKNIKNLDDFETHIEAVEFDFWNVRFKKYGQWKRDFYAEYERNGYFDLLTGFRIHGWFGKRAVLNYPIQGASFHCLLWSIIQINRFLQENNLQTKLVTQVHDSLLLDLHHDEIDIVLRKCNEVMTSDIKRHWPWINTPLNIEIDMAPLNGSWYDVHLVEMGNNACNCGMTWHWRQPTQMFCVGCGTIKN